MNPEDSDGRSRRPIVNSYVRCFGGLITIRPAEKSCFNCFAIDKAARFVSMYMMVQGFTALFTLFSAPRLSANLSDLSLTLTYCNEAFRVFSLLYGLKGLSGCNLRLARPLRELLSFLLLYAAFSLVQLSRLFVLCDEMKDIKDAKDISCPQVQAAWLTMVFTEYTIYAYMSYIVWSYAVKIENSREEMLLPRFLDPDHIRQQQEEAQAPRVMPTDQRGHTLAEYEASLNMSNPADPRSRPCDNPASGGSNDPGGAVQAFSGEAYRLD
jgi:hypothetical protein